MRPALLMVAPYNQAPIYRVGCVNPMNVNAVTHKSINYKPTVAIFFHTYSLLTYEFQFKF